MPVEYEAEYTEVEVVILAQTDAAIFAEYEEDAEWIPRSVIQDEGKGHELGDVVLMDVETWKLKDLGWLD